MITVYGYGFEVPKPPPPPTPWGTYLLAAAAAWWAWTKWGKGGRARVSNPRRRRRHGAVARRRRNPARRGGSAVYEDRPNGVRWPVAYGSRAEMEATIRQLRKIYPRKKFSLSASQRESNPRVRARVGRAVSIPWYGGRKRVLLKRVVGGGRALVQFPGGNIHNVPTAHLRGVK